MTTLAEYLADVAFDEAPGSLPSCKGYVGSADAEDTRIAAWYAAAVAWCDSKLGSHDFVDAAGDDIDPPAPCVLAVFEYVRAMRDVFARAGGAGVRKVKTGGREEEYSDGGATGAAGVAGAAAWQLLEAFVADVTLLTSGGGW